MKLNGGDHVKGATAVLAVVIFTMVVLLPFAYNIKVVVAQDGGYAIRNVNHSVEIMYGGYIMINETIEVTGEAPDSFLIGFPYKYGSYILKCVAYDAHNNALPVSLDVPLESRSGFYCAEVDLSQFSPQIFSVIFILSNGLITQTETGFKLDFPAYPSLVKDVARCEVVMVLPEDATNVTIEKDDGTVNNSIYVKENLPAFTYSLANATFSLAAERLQIIDLKELNREVRIDALGIVEVSDSYRIRNNSTISLAGLRLALPTDASNLSARDQLGRTLAVEAVDRGEKVSWCNVTFIVSLSASESTRLSVKYNLPNAVQEEANKFALNLSLFPPVNCYVQSVSVTVILPEGARLLNPEIISVGDTYGLARDVFQERLTVNMKDVTYLESAFLSSRNILQIAYEYNYLWLSFRPTLWVWALAIVGCAIAVSWRRPKAPAPAQIAIPKLPAGLRPEYVKSFIGAYEEKKRITSELESLETRARKGKVPRRRYRVQKKTLETRLNTVSRNTAEIKQKLLGAGSLYADLMRQLEIAETEINEVETNIKSIEVRHRRGELSLEAYRKLQADYRKRKEKAETTISGILLRLREETQ
ncbi:MAG: hypothetical protein ACUVUE_02615 [Candidatus Bathycorpusculaceae bacterium]